MTAVAGGQHVGAPITDRGQRTTMTVFGVIAACLQHSGMRAAVVSATAGFVDSYRHEALKACRQLHPTATTWRKGELHLNNDAVIMFRTVASFEDTTRFRGIELQLLAIEDCVPPDLDACLVNRVRSYDPARPVVGVYALAPGGSR